MQTNGLLSAVPYLLMWLGSMATGRLSGLVTNLIYFVIVIYFVIYFSQLATSCDKAIHHLPVFSNRSKTFTIIENYELVSTPVNYK